MPLGYNVLDIIVIHGFWENIIVIHGFFFLLLSYFVGYLSLCIMISIVPVILYEFVLFLSFALKKIKINCILNL